MALWKRKETRAELEVEDLLLRAVLTGQPVSKNIALNIPALVACIQYIANTVSMLPIKLYEETLGGERREVREITNDPRIKILNDDTGDTLDAVQFWRAIVTDYFLGKGGYAFIEREGNSFTGLYYVDETNVTIQSNSDPIRKEYVICVGDKQYYSYQFLKVLRNSKDGARGISLIEQSPLILSVAYHALKLEERQTKTGGNKKGFLKTKASLANEAIEVLRKSFKKMYNNESENVIVLNNGIEFQEASNTAIELQLNENKITNSAEICKLLNVPESIIKGTATGQEYINGFKQAVAPVLRAIECALNRDFLLEKEKRGEKVRYFAFDTKELTKGDIKTRYEAYKIGIDANVLQPDEARYMEDLPPLGLKFIRLGLKDVLYNPETKQIITPNTGQITALEKEGGDVENADRDQKQLDTD